MGPTPALRGLIKNIKERFKKILMSSVSEESARAPGNGVNPLRAGVGPMGPTLFQRHIAQWVEK